MNDPFSELGELLSATISDLLPIIVPIFGALVGLVLWAISVRDTPVSS